MTSEIHRKECHRYDIPGDAHFLTFSCFQRKPFLNRDRSRIWMLESLQVAQERDLFDLWAYVIMPEHVHLVLCPRRDIVISKILKTIKQSVSRKAIIWTQSHAPEFLRKMEDRQPDGKISHRFWQRGGGYDRNLRSVRDIHEKIHYVHNNPVRRNLCSRPEDWDWSSFNIWRNETRQPTIIHKQSLPKLTMQDEGINSGLINPFSL
ncbi:REP-associated tyrosine transposase [Rubinisphaera italica]|uniref:Transposase IS200 like protein n=1 Tax=Rubinisphaera italica TaxID=2527969 RepID=A0A5C5XKE0_9PLAN|nr:transposase [Rubinisphaera italica]TWT63324.1 Transposase IS200 like protein [Rubinisphaera italica]